MSQHAKWIIKAIILRNDMMPTSSRYVNDMTPTLCRYANCYNARLLVCIGVSIYNIISMIFQYVIVITVQCLRIYNIIIYQIYIAPFFTRKHVQRCFM